MFSGTIWFPVILQMLGVIVIVAEFLIPSAGLLSIAATGLFVYSLYLAFAEISPRIGMMFLVLDLIMVPVLVIAGLKLIGRSPAALRKTLSKEEGVSSQPKEFEQYVGAQGVALSHLRPAGIALIGGKRLDVVSRGEFIDKNVEVLVVEVTGNQIVVKKKG
jgi:membrane-bound serine protease (ClpP class)